MYITQYIGQHNADLVDDGCEGLGWTLGVEGWDALGDEEPVEEDGSPGHHGAWRRLLHEVVCRH